VRTSDVFAAGYCLNVRGTYAVRVTQNIVV